MIALPAYSRRILFFAAFSAFIAMEEKEISLLKYFDKHDKIIKKTKKA